MILYQNTGKMFDKVKRFSDYIINSKIAKKLELLIGDSDIMNLIIHGPPGCGKLTLARSIVAHHFPKTNIVVNPITYRTRINDGSMRDFDILGSSVHHEIPLNSYNFNDKFSVINILVNIIENRNILSNEYHVIIIKNANFLNELALKAIIKLTEKYSDNVRIIMTCCNVSRIGHTLNNFLKVRVPLEELKTREAYFRETYGPDIREEMITSNLFETTLNCERLTMEKDNGLADGIDIVNNHFKILFSSIRTGNINKYSVIRDTLAEILCLNIETSEIFHRFIKEFSGDIQRVKILTRYNEAISQTFKVPIHLEAMCAALLASFATNSKK